MKAENLQVRQLNNSIIELENYLTACEESAKQFNPETDQRFIDIWNERAEETRKQLERAKAELELASRDMIEVDDDFFANEQKRLEGMDKWSVNRLLDRDSNKIPERGGYFGGYTLITYYGKQAIVYVDDRNAKVKFMTPFYDKVFYGHNNGGESWSADERYNSGDADIVVLNRGLYNMVSKKSKGQPMCDEWFKELDKKYTYDKYSTQKYYSNAVREDGERVKVGLGGYIIRDVSAELAAAKAMLRDEILENWIKKGKLVVGGSGWEYRGAKTSVIPMEQAIKMFPNYHFGKGFYEMEWVTYRGQVALSMREYSALDME